MGLRSYAGNAKRTTLASDITSVSDTFNVSDATGYPSPAAGQGPFVIAVDLGLTTEEKMLVSARSNNTFTIAQRGFDGTSATTHRAGNTVDHVLSATDIREINAHVFDLTGDPHPQYLNPSEAGALYAPITHTHVAAKTVRIPHTFTLSGLVQVDNSNNDYFVPPFFVPVPAGQTATLAAVRARVASGGSLTWTLQRNGAGFAAGAYSGVGASTNASTVTNPQPLADGDAISLVINTISSAPKNLTVSLFLDYTA